MTDATTPTPRRRTPRLLAASAAALLSLPLAATVASAQTPPPNPAPSGQAASAEPARLENARTRCLAEIDRRLGTLDRLEQAAADATALTDEHAAAITAIAGQERAALTDLRPQVEAAANAQTLASLCRSVATDHRIYRLRVPQAHLTVGFDRASAAAERLASVADGLQARIDERAAGGEDTADAQAALDTMRSERDAAVAGIDGQADSLLALTPADYAANEAVVAPYRAALTSARVDLREAVAAGREAARALRA